MFWLDLETTGSELEHNYIIEIGAAITDMNLNVLDARDYVIGYDIVHENISPVVEEMHTKNGLWRDVANSKTRIGEADNELAEWIRKYNKSNHMAFAGSGVMHFDRKFIKRDLPLLDARLTHWAIDVGVMRRTFKYLLGIDEWPEDNKTHRAIDDVYFHIEEMKFALDKMRRGVYNIAKE